MIFSAIALSMAHSVHPFEPNAAIRIIEIALSVCAVGVGIERSIDDARRRCRSVLEWVGNAAIIIGGAFFAVIFIKVSASPSFYFTFTVNQGVAWSSVALSYTTLLLGLQRYSADWKGVK